MACAHIAMIGALLQLGVLPRLARDITPLTVALLDLPRSSAEAPALRLPPPPPLHSPQVEPLAPPPIVTTAPAAVPAPQPAPDRPSPALSDAAVTPTPAAITPAPAPAPALTPAPNPAAPPIRRQLPASAVAYRLPPAAELPRASRRAGESGTVWLRVVVDVAGLPAQVTVHRSSGYARLDEQALQAMRAARFHPHVDNGRPVEVEVIAPIEYPAE